MPIAAVPDYLGKDFSDASPGLRFGYYLPIWTTRQDQEQQVRKRANAKSFEGREISEHLERHGMDATIAHWCKRDRNPIPGLWQKNTDAAKQIWQSITKLGTDDRNLMQNLHTRQQQQALPLANSGQLITLDATAIAPFTTGLGNEHPLENGFAFLNPYGLPYLPGSGVKGVLRQAARELASGEWGEPQGWDEQTITALFGKEGKEGNKDHLRGALSFWDVLPQLKGDSLQVEIMTPHQGHYYQQKPHMGSAPPHESGQPNPISYLSVRPGSGFTFHVQCSQALLEHHAPALAQDQTWQTLLRAAFEHAFTWCGFGAKTAVGYGAMESQAMQQQRQQHEEKRRKELEAARQQQEVARQQAEAQPWPGARLKFNRGNKALTVEKDGKTAVAIAPKGEELLATLPPDVRKKVETNQFVRVTAYVADNILVRVEA
ncbi:MAG: type III-B CRISPR module RAMP protein Cmr6 [Thiohalomonadaceae bacterium]